MEAPPVQYVTTSDGFSIAYTVCGEGPPFVFMPRAFNHVQLLWSLATYRFPLELLAARFQVICYDGRGQGLSTRGLPATHSLDDNELDLKTVVEKLRLDRFVLFGPVISGGVAIQYAVKHPDRLDALILWNPLIGDPALDSPVSIGLDLPVQNWELFLEIYAGFVYPLEEASIAKRLLQESVTQADRVDVFTARRRTKTEAIAAEIRVPTLILAPRGGSWALAAEKASKRYAATIPNAQLALFDDLGGGLFLPGPATPPAILVIDDFLSRLSTRTDMSHDGTVVSEPGLSTRELEVLRLVAAGKSSREIGEELVLSRRTVERHIANIYLKTETHGRAQLATYALRNGLT